MRTQKEVEDELRIESNKRWSRGYVNIGKKLELQKELAKIKKKKKSK